MAGWWSAAWSTSPERCLETVSGALLSAYGDREAYVVVTALEEGLEMAGVSLLLGALLLARESALRRAAAVRS